jgi:hypothetical protein
MPAVVTPQLAWVATLHGGSAVAAGASLTVTFHLTAGWQAQIPVLARANTASLDSIAQAYASDDGGATYATSPIAAVSIPSLGNHNTDQIATLVLPTGQYAIRLLASSPTVTFAVLTQQILTAVNQV